MSARSELFAAVALLNGKGVFGRSFRLRVRFYVYDPGGGRTLAAVELERAAAGHIPLMMCGGEGPDEESSAAVALRNLMSGENLARQFFPAVGSLPELELMLAVRGGEAAE